MSKVKDGLAEVLLERAEQEERRRREAEAEERRRKAAEKWLRLLREERRRERLEAIRLRRLREERERRWREELARKLQREIDQAVKKAKREKLQEYLAHYDKYHIIKKNADELRGQLLGMGLSPTKVESALQTFTEFCMRGWPEFYRSKCRYTPAEKLAFLIDPIQSAMWVSLLPA